MKITPLKALSDNYIWVFEERNKAIVVDPGVAEPVIDWLQEYHLELAVILLTHAHSDHIDGVSQLIAQYENVIVYGPQEVEEIATKTVQSGDTFNVFGHEVQVFLTAGHTMGHVSYLVDGDTLFCGDALFSAGCGRVFTQDYQAQYESLQRFKQFNDHVKVYAGHEYTLTNLNFALSIEPNNQQIQSYREVIANKVQRGLPTLPSSIGIEREINLFLRAETPDDFKRLRDLRDVF